MKEITIELSLILPYIILFYVIFNIVTIIADKLDKYKFKGIISYFNPFRTYNNDAGSYIFVFFISFLPYIVICVIYSTFIKPYTFNIIW